MKIIKVMLLTISIYHNNNNTQFFTTPMSTTRNRIADVYLSRYQQRNDFFNKKFLRRCLKNGSDWELSKRSERRLLQTVVAACLKPRLP